MTASSTLGRRRFLTGSAGTAAALLAAPAIDSLLAAGRAAADTADTADTATGSAVSPFVEHYTTNTAADLTAADNAAVQILSGMARLWAPGTAWNTGTALDPRLLRATMRHSAHVTAARTSQQAKQAFIHDRQDQSYGMIDGLGPLAPLYKTGAKAVTSITGAPDSTPPAPISDTVPPGAPAGSATGAGSATSDLGAVVTLVQTLRGTFSSSNPAKLAYDYPRPWRMTEDSTVADTGTTDAFGYPVYRSQVSVAPQLLRQRSLTPATDGGFPSGHTNAFFLAGIAYAYAVPERFQELITRAFELADSRIVAGMHSAVDVIGGRILGTALAAAILADPANTTTKKAARAEALAYFTTHTGTTPDTLAAYAHSATAPADPYADRETNARTIEPFFTYGLPADHAAKHQPMTVPEGAEVLLETRLPYLDATQRRAVLATTALPPGNRLLDGPELWGRLNLFAAADGFGSFDTDIHVAMDAAAGGFHAADTWRNTIGGPGSLTKTGTGTLTLTGDNHYRGGTTITGGVLSAATPTAFGTGDLHVTAGTLGVQLTENSSALRINGLARLEPNSALLIDTTAWDPRHTHRTHPIIDACDLRGTFGSITVTTPGYHAEPHYTATGLTVRIRCAR